MSGSQSGSTGTGNQSRALLALLLPGPREKMIIEMGAIQIGNTERPSTLKWKGKFHVAITYQMICNPLC